MSAAPIDAETIARELVLPARRARAPHALVDPAIYRALGDAGLMAMNVPRAYGGSERGPIAYVHAVIAVARACASTAVTMAVTNMVGEIVAKLGAEPQRAAVCPVLAGGGLGAFALSEPDAGSDAGSLRTRATAIPGGYRLDGSKQWISHGDAAAHVVVWARTGGPGTRGLSCFLTSASAPGYVVVRRELKMGLSGSATCELAFDGLEVRDDDRLGALGGGFPIAMMALDGGRIGIAAQAIGLAERVFDVLVAVGHGLAADARVAIDRARAIVLEAARLKAAGEPFSETAAMAKMLASETAVALGTRAQAVITDESARAELALALRDARVTMIYEGTSEIQRLVVARSLFAGAS